MTFHLNRGHMIAIALIILLASWLIGGAITEEDSYKNPRPLIMDSGLRKVQVERMQGELIERNIIVSGKTAANRSVDLRTEVKTKVIAIRKSKGEAVKKGETIIELDQRDWPERVAQAKANLQQREIEFESAQKLFKKGLYNQAQVAQARTMLASAKADYTNASLARASISVKAPFDGIVDQRYVEVGDYVKDETPLVKVLDFSPFLVTGHVAEKDAAFINIGDQASATLVTGDIVTGKVKFIAAESDPNTRTFPIELEVDNPSGNMTSGLTARISVPQPKQFAHKVSPALLILNEEGHLGIKGIDADHKVIFHNIEILRAEGSGIWVTGLEEQAQVITVGQGFVAYGEQVEPVFKEDAEPNQDLAADAVEPGI